MRRFVDIVENFISEKMNSALNTPEFQRWFQGSKVIDHAGEPLIVYHGTDRSFSSIEKRGESHDTGIYLTPDPQYASGYANKFTRDIYPGSNVQPYYVSMKNPFFALTKPTDVDLKIGTRGAMTDAVILYLEEQGYDGVIAGLTDYEYEIGARTIEKHAHEICAFHPYQLRSAISNNEIGLSDLNENVDARKNRAHQMGFDVSSVWYHGTNKTDIRAFDPAKLGQNTNAKSASKGFFFASNPDVAVSYGKHERYHSDEWLKKIEELKMTLSSLETERKYLIDKIWGDRGNEEENLRKKFYSGPKNKRISADEYYSGLNAIHAKYNTDENQALIKKYNQIDKEITAINSRINAKPINAISTAVVHPVYLKMRNPLIYDMGGSPYREISYNDLLIKARRGRRDGLIIKNTYDPGYRGAENPLTDIAVVFAPSQIRSIFANFDPEKIDSPNISD